MKTNIVPLNKKAVAKMPNKIIQDRTFKGLTLLARKVLLYTINLENQREHQLKHIPPSKRGEGSLTFKVRWQELRAHITPSAKASLAAHDYRDLKLAVNQLFALQAKKEEQSVKGKARVRAYHFLDHYDMEDDKSLLTYSLSPEFKNALRIFEEKGFAKVPIADAIVTSDIRQLDMLMLACTVLNLYATSQRTFEVGWLREHFDLQGASYDAWPEVRRKLKAYADAVSEKTNYHVSLEAVPDKVDARRVAAVLFEVKLKTGAPPPAQHIPPTPSMDEFWAQQLAVAKKKPTVVRRVVEAVEEEAPAPPSKPRFKLPIKRKPLDEQEARRQRFATKFPQYPLWFGPTTAPRPYRPGDGDD